MTDFAALVPGHGGEHSGMREQVAARRPELLALAIELVGSDPFLRLGEGTTFLQPAIYCASIAGFGRLGPDRVPGVAAGHSLGEYAALAAAGAFSIEDGLKLVILRGRVAQAAADASPGGMLVVGRAVEQAAALAGRHGLAVANDNSPRQTVLSGDDAALASAAAEAGERGWPTHRLPTAVPFHSDAMRPAAESLAAALGEVATAEPEFPVYSGMTAAPFDDVRTQLSRALVEPVRWREVVLAIAERGIRRYVEVGPGRVLTRMLRKTLPGVDADSLDEPAAPRSLAEG